MHLSRRTAKTGTRSASCCGLCVSPTVCWHDGWGRGPGCGGYLRNPCALPRFINPGMPAVVDNEQDVVRFMLLDEGAYSHHDVQVGVVGGYGKDVRLEAVILAKAGLEVFELWQDEQVVRLPV